MKLINFKSFTISVILCALFFSCSCPVKKQGNFRHVVAFKFKPEVSKQKIDEIITEFAGLQTKIPTITGFEGGKDISNENLHKGYTHCFTVSFENEAGRAVYQPHPAHLEFGKHITPLLEKVFVMDYIAK